MTSFPRCFGPVLLLLLAVPTWGRAQDAADTEAATVVKIASAGVRRYEPGTWSTLAINGTNKTKFDSDEFVSIFIGENSHLQFARRFWLPAGTRRQTFVPILIPETSESNPAQSESPSPQTTAFMMRIKETDGAETFEDNPMDTHILDHPLLLDYGQTKSGILFHRNMPDETGVAPDVDWASYETAYKARESALGTSVLIDFGGDFIPPFPSTLDSLDQMIISGDRILNDTAGLANLRHWLQLGGRIWIMLDSTSMETVTALLGNETCCSLIDRVELNDFQLEDLSVSQSRSDKPAVESWSAETPVELLRVFAGTDDVHCQIDGWPAAFWQKVGDGEVLFTTLGPRGWIESGDPKPALVTLARRFFQTRETAKLDSAAMGSLLSDQIGYRIPTRRLAAWILGLNSLAILSFGCWWARQRRLEHLAWFVPSVALVASAVFLAIGNRNAGAVPSTVAVGQFVRVSKATNESHISAVSAIYRQDSGDVELTAKRGSSLAVNPREAHGSIKRIVWDDDGRSRWANVRQASGVVRYVDSRQTVSHGIPIVAHGTFDASGFQGTLAGIDAGLCEDAVIVAVPAPVAAVSLDSGGSFQVGAGDVLAGGQYIADGLMSDRQRGRQQLLRQLLVSSALSPLGAETSLLVWTPAVEMGVEFDPSFDKLGSALTAIPLQIERPVAGTNVQIPATFIRIESFAGLQGASSVFDQRTGRWLENATKPTRSQLRCVVPPELLPLQLNRVTVTIKINAPSRTLTIEGLVDGKPRLLHQQANPKLVPKFVIDQPEVLQLDATGGFYLTIAVSETEKQREHREGQATNDATNFDNSTWQIDYVRVDAEGTVR